MERDERAKWAQRLRPSLKERVADSSLRAVAAEVDGVSYGAINNLINEVDVPSERTLRALERYLEGTNGEAAVADYNEDREEAELARAGALPEPLLRIMERESIAAVIRAQGMRDACRAARLEAEKAVNRGEWTRPPARRITPMEPTKPRRPGEEGREAS